MILYTQYNYIIHTIRYTNLKRLYNKFIITVQLQYVDIDFKLINNNV